jgi:WD40-like Beta Propeller Repeat
MRGATAVVVAVCLFGVIGLTGCSPPWDVGRTPGASSPSPQPLPPAADGLAFVRDGKSFVIKAGAAKEVAADGGEKVDLAYSADGKMLIVTEARGSQRVVRLLDAGDRTSSTVVLESGDGSNLGPVRAATASGPLYRAELGDPANSLVVSALTPGSKSSTVALQAAFSGEFDVDARSGSIVYTGAGQNPATVMLRTGDAERPLATGLAAAFTPSFSSDGGQICLTGAERAGGPIAVYTVDRESGERRVVEGTEDLTPTSPVFSPDGASIAFRSAVDGSLWIASSIGGAPRKLDVTADEAPIGW